MKVVVKLKYILIIMFLFAVGDFAQSNPNFFSLRNRKKFADYLFCKKDYLRAFDEYRVYLNTMNNDTIKFKIAIGFRRMHRYKESLDYFKSLFFNSQFTNQARNEFFKTLLMSNNFKAIQRYVKEPIFQTNDSLNIPSKLFYMSRLLGSFNLPDSGKIKKIFSTKDFNDVKKIYLMKKKLPLKNPITAGILSAIIPGAGKIYTEKYGDGITAFLLTAALGTLAYTNSKAHHQFRAWLFGGLTLLFYAGNIYGSVASAQLFNAGVTFEFGEKLKLFLNKKNYFIPQYDFICR